MSSIKKKLVKIGISAYWGSHFLLLEQILKGLSCVN